MIQPMNVEVIQSQSKNGKCSLQHSQEYRNGINDYLRKKGITDVSKYQIHFNNGQLHYDRWEYSIPRPTDVQAITTLPTFTMVETRIFELNITIRFHLLIINAHGESFRPNDQTIVGVKPISENKVTDEKIEIVLRTDKYVNNMWKWHDVKDSIAVHDGLIHYSNVEPYKWRVVALVSRIGTDHSSHRAPHYYTFPANAH